MVPAWIPKHDSWYTSTDKPTSMSRAVIGGAFGVTVGIIAVQEIIQCKEWPWPPRFVGTGIVFGMIDLLSLVNDELATVFAVGIVLAIIVGTFTPSSSPLQMKFVKPVCGKHSCATAQPASYKNLAQPTPDQTLA